MSDKTAIQWTDSTWNPTTGCAKVSEGCRNCYADRLAHRLQAMGNPKFQNGFDVTIHPGALDQPRKWRRPRRIFVDSMSDLFHEDVPDDFVRQVFDVMAREERHTFQVLTKRPERAASLAAGLPWSPNIWLGVSVEDGRVLHRVDALRSIPAAVRFLSIEPLIGPIGDLDLNGIHWVIVGGESGPGHRPCSPQWVRSVRDQCVAAGVPFFFKQWGGRTPKDGGRELDGRTWDEFPATREVLPMT
jgi:protein gp37